MKCGACDNKKTNSKEVKKICHCEIEIARLRQKINKQNDKK